MPIQHNARAVLGDLTKSLSTRQKYKQDLVKKLTLTALGDAQTLSPVDTGLFRASHDLTIGEPSKIAPRTPPSNRQPGDPPIGEYVAEVGKRTEEALGRLAPAIAQLDGLQVFLSNNLEYAQALENGHSQQAPMGVYKIVREKAEQGWNRVVLGIDDNG